MMMKTKMSDWELEYRKDGYDGPGWYWHFETETDRWDYGAYSDKEAAENDWKGMVEQHGHNTGVCSSDDLKRVKVNKRERGK